MPKKLLGAILAGGKSRRFGSDKAAVTVHGRPLMQHAIDGLSHQVNALVSCGYPWPDIELVADRPCPDLGPLGGLNAALAIAAERQFDAVITVSVDSYPIPHDLAKLLSGTAPCYIANHYTIGKWPVSLAPALDTHLAQGYRSMMSWIETCNATPILVDRAIVNINTVRDVPAS